MTCRVLIAKLEKIVKGLYGRGVRLERFGSSVCEFSTIHSDLDLTILLDDPKSGKHAVVLTTAEKHEILKKLSKSFRFQHGMRSYAVLGARVPVIKLQDPQTGVRQIVMSQTLYPVFR